MYVNTHTHAHTHTHTETLLTDEWQQLGVVIGHDKERDVCEPAAGLEVAEGAGHALLPPTVPHKHLPQESNTHTVQRNHPREVYTGVYIYTQAHTEETVV